MQIFDKRHNLSHVTDSLVKRNERFPRFDVFVLSGVGTALVALELFNESLKFIGINVVPKSSTPGSELIINESSEIPADF
jgi:hypothetical protein